MLSLKFRRRMILLYTPTMTILQARPSIHNSLKNRIILPLQNTKNKGNQNKRA